MEVAVLICGVISFVSIRIPLSSKLCVRKEIYESREQKGSWRIVLSSDISRVNSLFAQFMGNEGITQSVASFKIIIFTGLLVFFDNKDLN